ncbi:MAG: hypothetical protein IJE22_03400 [Oscillibacter sp.]|nr:hypothetical protein [Oscillibacter sp.]
MEEIIFTKRKTTIRDGRAAVQEWKHHGVVMDGRFLPKRSIGKRFFYSAPEARDGVYHTQSVEIVRGESQIMQRAA